MISQTILISDGGTVQACTGTFLDAGNIGDYSNNEDFTITICPNDATSESIQIDFTNFDIETPGFFGFFDLLRIYDGNNTSAPLIGNFAGTNSPGTIVATNNTGCLTFRFSSDGIFTRPGWSANISCVSPVNTPLTLFDQFNGYVDYAVTGGTLRDDTVSTCTTVLSSSGTLTSSSIIPATATIEKAYLLWAHSSTTPDNTVTFEGRTITADTINQGFVNINGGLNFYGMVSNITSIIKGIANPFGNTYDFSGLTIDNTDTTHSYCTSSVVLGAWGLMIFYSDPSLPASRINFYNGFDPQQNDSNDFTLGGFFATGNSGSKTSVLSWEGDPLFPTNGNESLSITSSLGTFPLSGDGDNNGTTINNPYNSTIYDNSVTPNVSNLNTYGVDFDTYNTSSFIDSGETEITTSVNVGQDLVILNSVLLKVPGNLIVGTVFEDINYPGGAGRNLTTSSGVGVENVTLELYRETAPGSFTLEDVTTTDTNGEYVFGGMADGTYKVRVVNSSVSSTRVGGDICTACLPIQTYRRNYASGGTFTDLTTEIGGANPLATLDTPEVTTTGDPLNAAALTISDVTISGDGAVGLDFGFNFNTIVNTNEDGQGSLEQFIVNSNNLDETGLDIEAHPNDASLNPAAGEDTSIFMIPANPDPLGRTADPRYNIAGGYFDILTTTNLSAITGTNSTNTKIDGRTQTAYSGNTNTTIIVSGSTTVGTTMVALPNYDSPEIQVQRGNGSGYVFDIRSNNVTVRNMAIFANNNSADGVRVTSGSGISVQSNIIGVNAIGVLEGNTRHGVRVNGGTSTITENYFARNRVTGIRSNNSPTTTISLNHITTNGSNTCGSGSIDIRGGTTVDIRNNLIDNASSFGIRDLIGNNNTISENTITSSGQNAACTNNSGISLQNSDSSVMNNIINSNNGAGISITVVSPVTTSSGNTISQNSIFSNGTVANPALGIDINNDGVTINDTGDPPAGPNNQLNFPVFESAAISGNNLIVNGWVGNGATVEFFLSDISTGDAVIGDNSIDGPSGTITQDYGEGKVFLGSSIEGSTDDNDSNVTAYPADIDGNTDNTNRFSFIIPLGTSIPVGSTVTATATVGGSTSEFGVTYVAGAATVITNRKITYRVKRN